MRPAYTEHYTVRDYQTWEGDWELIHGAPYAMAPSLRVSRQIVAGQVLTELNLAMANCDACRALMGMNRDVANDTVVRPGAMVICHEPDERVTRRPEGVFEVVSPRKAQRDEHLKFDLYEREGVEWYVLIYPEHNTAKIYRREAGRFAKVTDVGDERFTFTFAGWADAIKPIGRA